MTSQEITDRHGVKLSPLNPGDWMVDVSAHRYQDGKKRKVAFHWQARGQNGLFYSGLAVSQRIAEHMAQLNAIRLPRDPG